MEFTNFSRIMKIFDRFFSLFNFAGSEEKLFFKDQIFWSLARNGGLCFFEEGELSDVSFAIPRQYVDKFANIKSDKFFFEKKGKQYKIKTGAVSTLLVSEAAGLDFDSKNFIPSGEKMIPFSDKMMDAISGLKFVLKFGEEFVDVGGIYFSEKYAYATDRVRVMRIRNDCQEVAGKVLPANLINFLTFFDYKPKYLAFEKNSIYLFYSSPDKAEDEKNNSIEFIVFSSESAHRFHEIEEAFNNLIPEEKSLSVYLKENNESILQELDNFISLAGADKALYGYSTVTLKKNFSSMNISKKLMSGEITADLPINKSVGDISFKINERFLYDGFARFSGFIVSDKCTFFTDKEKDYLIMLMQ